MEDSVIQSLIKLTAMLAIWQNHCLFCTDLNFIPMKFALSLLFVLAGFAGFAQTQEEEKIWLNETTHDFGNIPQGTPVYTTFELKGVGDQLKLEMVQASCGCTTPEFKAGTYPAGEKVVIKVGFNAGALGAFNKPITITYHKGDRDY